MRVVETLLSKILELDNDFDLLKLKFSLQYDENTIHLLTCNKSKINNKITDLTIKDIQNKNNCEYCIKDYNDLIESISPKYIYNLLSFDNIIIKLMENLQKDFIINKNTLAFDIIEEIEFINAELINLTKVYLKINTKDQKLNKMYKDIIIIADNYIRNIIASERVKKELFVQREQKGGFDINREVISTYNPISYQNNNNSYEYNEYIHALELIYLGYKDSSKKVVLLPNWVYNQIKIYKPKQLGEKYYDIDNKAHEIAKKLFEESVDDEMYSDYKEAYKASNILL